MATDPQAVTTWFEMTRNDPTVGWEQIEPARVPTTPTEITLAEARENMHAAWDEIDKVQDMIDGHDGPGKPYGLMAAALSQVAHTEAEFFKAWEADNKARAEKLGEITQQEGTEND